MSLLRELDLEAEDRMLDLEFFPHEVPLGQPPCLICQDFDCSCKLLSRYELSLVSNLTRDRRSRVAGISALPATPDLPMAGSA